MENLSNPPVFHTLVQIHINENPNFKDAINAIHQDFHKLGFIEKRTEEIQELEFTTHSNQPKVSTMTSWHFINFEQDAGFVLNPNFILFHTTNYSNFDSFKEFLLSGIKIINEHLDNIIVERLGLRYLNAVILKEGDRIDEYLATDLISVNEKLGLDAKNFKIKHSMNERILLCEETNETCVSRVVSAYLDNSNPLMPQELVPLIEHLKIKDRLKNINGLMTLIDLDSSKLNIRLKATDTTDINENLSQLHDSVTTVFKTLTNIGAFR